MLCRCATTGAAPAVMNQGDQFYRDGFLVLPGFLSGARLRAAKLEFDALLNGDVPCLGRKETESGVILTGGRLDLKFSAVAHPVIAETFTDQSLLEIITGYMGRFYGRSIGPDEIYLNEQMEIERNDRIGTTNNSTWHYDRVPSIKCALFLTDTTEEHGAMQVIPGSHFTGRACSLSFLEKNPDPLFVDNYVEFSSEPETRTLAVKAGTVVVFDTLGVHRGGQIKAAGERLAIRGVTWPPTLSREYFTTTTPIDRSTFRLFHPFDRTGQTVADQRHLFVS